MTFLIAAISLGFLGSFHCIGMCGPIAMALPVHAMPLRKRFFSILSYNSGRIITYTLLGAFFGFIGQSFFFFGFQQKLSIALGVIILLGLIFSQRSINKYLFTHKIYTLLNKVKSKISAQFQKKTMRSFFSIGLLNGLLPCGLVYLGIAGAVSTGSIFKGAIFMMVFGMGTLPFMFAISHTSHLITLNTRTKIRKAMPLMIGLMAILLVLRGLNLNIKYISPALAEEETVSATCNKQINCCHKK
ncbi:MAG: sulfite exporter TauE/SafE family protein [Bacteroidetes bacterium]|nr:sulfite exporter TauE/SafE family protein [Bacteroidota bacterium]